MPREVYVTHTQEQLLLDAVKKASEVMLCLWPGGEGRVADLEVKTKADQSSVTKADKLSSGILLDALYTLFPKDIVLSEEAPRPPKAKEQERVWFVDPLDGTEAFVKGRKSFSILLALTVEGRAVYSIICRPGLQFLAVAARGGGAVINGSRIRVSENRTITPERFCSLNLDEDLGGTCRLGWTDAFLAVAAGDIDGAVIGLGGFHSWDVAALTVLVRAAGGQVSDSRGRTVRFYQSSLGFNRIVVSNGHLHNQLLGLLHGDHTIA